MQQEQRWSRRELRRTFESPGNHPRGCRVVNLRHHRDLERRSHPGMARARRGANRITGEPLLTCVVAIMRVVRFLRRLGGTDNISVSRQLTRVPQNEKQD